MSKRLLAIPFLAALLAVGCASETAADDGGEASGAAIASNAEFDRAKAIVRRIDYLPFEFKTNGCYARAFYMSMELAAERIESNAVYAFAKNKSKAAQLEVGATTWDYHVAPLLKVQTEAGNLVPRVLDPSIVEEPMTTESWLTKMGHPPSESAETKPKVFYVQGSDYSDQSGKDHPRSKTVPDFGALAPFNVNEIQHACGVMHEFLGCDETQDQTKVKARREKLLRRTKDLIDKLRDLDKLNPNARFSMEACADFDQVKCESSK